MMLEKKKDVRKTFISLVAVALFLALVLVLAQKGVRVVPKVGLPQGNTLSFSSSSGDQTSSVYHEKKQGYYTYFLIKTIRDAKGNISMKELFDRTSAAVKRATALIDKIQEPQCMASPTWIGWEDIKLETPVVTP